MDTVVERTMESPRGAMAKVLNSPSNRVQTPDVQLS